MESASPVEFEYRDWIDLNEPVAEDYPQPRNTEDANNSGGSDNPNNGPNPEDPSNNNNNNGEEPEGPLEFDDLIGKRTVIVLF